MPWWEKRVGTRWMVDEERRLLVWVASAARRPRAKECRRALSLSRSSSTQLLRPRYFFSFFPLREGELIFNLFQLTMFTASGFFQLLDRTRCDIKLLRTNDTHCFALSTLKVAVTTLKRLSATGDRLSHILRAFNVVTPPFCEPWSIRSKKQHLARVCCYLSLIS